MRQALKLHPDSLCAAATRIDVDVTRPRAGSVVFSYVVTGTIGDLRLPPITSPTRTEELWQTTCFEAFIRTSAKAAYYELNFAPSTRWAAYEFTGYRSGMRAATEIGTPRIEVQTSPGLFTLRAALELDRLSGLPRGSVWSLGLSALIEETNGRKSYWALAHPAGKADFHHSDCFAHESSPP
jgi:hypothetical protein